MGQEIMAACSTEDSCSKSTSSLSLAEQLLGLGPSKASQPLLQPSEQSQGLLSLPCYLGAEAAIPASTAPEGKVRQEWGGKEGR